MSVTIVPNKKTGKYVVPSSTGKSFRVQGKSDGELVEFATGISGRQSRPLGFHRFTTEADANAFVESVAKNGYVHPTARIVYIDTLDPIVGEKLEYGIRYPYPMNLPRTHRAEVQRVAALKGVTLQQSGRPIYRNKFITFNPETKDVILSPDNQEQIDAFIKTLNLAAIPVDNPQGGMSAAKEARLAELKAIPKAKRTAEQKEELANLLED